MDCSSPRLLAMTWEGLFRRLAGTLPFVLRSDIVMRLDVLPVAFVPPVEDRTRDEDRGERAGHDTNEEREREIIDHTAAKDEQRERREEGRQTREDRTREHAVRREVDHVPQIHRGVQLQLFADAVEHDD